MAECGNSDHKARIELYEPNELDGAIVEQKQRAFSDGSLKVYDIVYRSQGLLVKGCLVLPDRPLPVPGLLYCRGGIGRFGLVGPERLADLARLGYAVFAPFYRGTEGAEGRDRFGGEDRYDVYSALVLLHSLSETNDQPIALLGFSRGSIMALAAARECSLAGPVVIWGGVSDLKLTYEERVDLRRMLKRVVGHPLKSPEEYEKRSPVCWAGQLRSPVLIIHGSDDRQVGIEHASRLAFAMHKVGKPFTLRLFPGQGHRFTAATDAAALELIHQWISNSNREGSATIV